MKTQHTPGPWKYHLGRGANPRFHIQTSGGYQIASTTELVRHSQAMPENEARDANARLIAAAPELLEALRECVYILERFPARDPNGETCGNMVPTSAIAAIQKAQDD